MVLGISCPVLHYGVGYWWPCVTLWCWVLVALCYIMVLVLVALCYIMVLGISGPVLH